MKFNLDKQEHFDVNWLKKEHRKRQKIGFPFIERFKRWFCNQFPFYCFKAPCIFTNFRSTSPKFLLKELQALFFSGFEGQRASNF